MSDTFGPWIAKRDSDGGYMVVQNFVSCWLDASDVKLSESAVLPLQGTEWSQFPAMHRIAHNDGAMTKEMAWLIAAAPDLLDACKDALAHRPDCDDPNPDLTTIALRAAIQRAETGCT